MGKEGTHRKYDNAVYLYDEGKYIEALDIFDELLVQVPKSRHVMYSRSLCLAALGRTKEAWAICDTLTNMSDEGARKLASKLEDLLAEKVKEKQVEKQKLPHSSGLERTDEPVARSAWRKPVKALAVCLILAGVAVGIVVWRSQAGEDIGPSQTSTHMGQLSATVPDAYLETATFYRLGSERGVRYAVFLAPSHGEASPADAPQTEDCVGGLVAADWERVKKGAHTAVFMAGGSEALEGTERNELVRTVVLPMAGTALSADLEWRELQTIHPGSARTLAAVTASCGQPDHEETWMTLSRSLGLLGKTYWWGRIGVATDEAGAITHLLLRTFPGDKR